jgi:hypothetical protein
MESGLEFSEEGDELKKLHGLHTLTNSKDVTLSSSSLATTTLQNTTIPGQ